MNTNDAVAVLREALDKLIDIASTCDGWASFPRGALEQANAALIATDSAATVAKDGGEARRRATDAEITDWALRHNIGNMLGNEARAAFEDAESLHMTYAAPKPEASAATQQAGEDADKALMYSVLMEIFNRRPCDYGLDLSAVRNADIAAFERIKHITMPHWYAAPISEDTGKGDAVTAVIQAITGEEETETRSYRIAEKLRKRGISTNMTFGVDDAGKPVLNIPAAQVSDGDAMPPMTTRDIAYKGMMLADQALDRLKAARATIPSLRDDATFKELLRTYGHAMYNGTVCSSDGIIAHVDALIAEAKDAARTVTGSGGSIGDDAAFLDLITELTCSVEELSHQRPAAFNALVAYIDARTARNAGVAAPDTSARDVLQEALQDAAEDWWMSNRPLDFSADDHFASPTVNCSGHEKPLALAITAIIAKSKGGA